ncbi:uracil-DNA glycosylase family protein [Bacteroides sp. 519]|uniref:uracil-DNA glycosylase family protein n=1 Tax=Bacteroides sp. 519 TaxID=2302937 RepID=UPI0013D28C96|nr:uracil-DNA glycosylase family protein [Bacteroides sp. 519]NDV56934.1 uracil-DNA glycosylase family protein [Bacteroides sp. 519]
MNEITIEKHPLEPFLPLNTKLLMLGSFPPQRKRWSMDFYYPNWNNDMWRIFGLIFFNNKNKFLNEKAKTFCKEEIINLLNTQGIGIFDTATEIRRLQDNASDKFLEVVRPTNIKELLTKIPGCEAIVTTGQKATDTLLDQLNIAAPKVGGFTSFVLEGKPMKLFRMPSSSRAYPLALDKKAEVYQSMFHELKMI